MNENIQDVAVFSNTANDFQLIRQLLARTGFRLNVYAGKDTRSANGTDEDVMIVCHRRTTDEPIPRLPSGRLPSRLIVLSDCDEEQSMVDTLEAGAHHYFSINESARVLTARLAAAMRSHKQSNIAVLDLYPFKFDVERRKVTHKGKPIHLSPREFALAYFLFANHGKVVFDSELMVTIWTLPSSMDSRRIDTAVCRIRKKLNLYDNESGWVLHRLRQVGYQLLREKPVTNINAAAAAALTLVTKESVAERDHQHRVFNSKISCKVLPNSATISSSSASLAINGGVRRT